MQYLKRHTKLWITIYSKNSHKDLVGFLDADQAGDLNNHKSASRYMFLVNGTAVTQLEK